MTIMTMLQINDYLFSPFPDQQKGPSVADPSRRAKIANKLSIHVLAIEIFVKTCLYACQIVYKAVWNPEIDSEK